MKADSHPFVKLYFKDLEYLFRVSKPAITLFLELTKLIKTDTHTFPNAVILSPASKKAIAVRAGIAKKLSDPNSYNVNKYLTELTTAKLVSRIDTNTYILNPNIVGRVDWKLSNMIHQVSSEVTQEMLSKNIVDVIAEQSSKHPENLQTSWTGNM